MEISFRPATMEDAAMLLLWRNDPLTRANSHNTDEVSWEDHLRWLQATIASPNRRLHVAELDGRPVGTVRADREGESFELSWTVAPEVRRNGIGKAMVAAFLLLLNGPVRAEVKQSNVASAKIAMGVGLSMTRQVNGLMHFQNGSPFDVFG